MASQPSSGEFDPRYDPAFQRGYRPPASPPAPAVARNPWIGGLWIMAALFVAAGVAGQVVALLPPDDSSAASYHLVPALAGALAPWFGGAGLASVIGVVILNAARWRSR